MANQQQPYQPAPPFAPRSPRLLALTLLVGALLPLVSAVGASTPGAVARARMLPLALATSTAPPTPAWPDDGAVDHPIPSTGCGQPPATRPGTTAQATLAVNPATNEGYAIRSYLIHVGQGYDPARPTPLVLVFHGGGDTSAGAEASTGFSPFADQRHFLAVYPQGLPYTELGPGFTTWAATGPFDTFDNGVDDLRYVSDLLDALQRQYCVDPLRIYATGFSAGGAMTNFLTCGLTGRIAAFAPMSGDAYQFLGGCDPHHPTSLLEFHGLADPYEVYVGIPAREDPDWRRTGVLEWLSGWAARDGCTAGPTSFLNAPPVYGEQWTGCHAGTAVAHYRISGLGHTWPPPIAGQSVLAVMWSFFQAHPLVGT